MCDAVADPYVRRMATETRPTLIDEKMLRRFNERAPEHDNASLTASTPKEH